MGLRWSASAEDDLRDIFQYIRRANPSAARAILDRIEDGARLLLDHRHIGRPGRRAGTREKPIVGTPYVLIYAVDRDAVEIVRVLHGARDWPGD
jgi:addiction module RelE/StbE family toxin